jgi:ribonuclease P protein component
MSPASVTEMAVRAPANPLVTLKKRPEFQRIRGGVRVNAQAFLLEAKPRVPADQAGPRFGLTITKKIGGAVQRNKIRRRLKDALRRLQGEHARPGFDYVLVARGPSLDCSFALLMADVASALRRAHAPAKTGAKQPPRDTSVR